MRRLLLPVILGVLVAGCAADDHGQGTSDPSTSSAGTSAPAGTGSSSSASTDPFVRDTAPPCWEHLGAPLPAEGEERQSQASRGVAVLATDPLLLEVREGPVQPPSQYQYLALGDHGIRSLENASGRFLQVHVERVHTDVATNQQQGPALQVWVNATLAAGDYTVDACVQKSNPPFRGYSSTEHRYAHFTRGG